MTESQIRYHARRRGFCVLQTRGLEYERRARTGAGTYLLLNQNTNAAVLCAATLEEIAAFLAGSQPNSALH